MEDCSFDKGKGFQMRTLVIRILTQITQGDGVGSFVMSELSD